LFESKRIGLGSVEVGMRSTRRQPFILITIGALFVLFPVLAYLQYEWQGQVSLALRAQMQEQMQRAADQFNVDFGRTVTDLYQSFQLVPPEVGTPAERRAQLRRQYEQAYAHWNEVAPNPRIVRNLFLVTPFDELPTSVERLDSATGKFQSAPAPGVIPMLPTRVKAGIIQFGGQSGGTTGKVVRIPAPMIDWKTPALVIPVMDVSETPFALPTPIAEAIVEMNLDYIRSDLIPALAKLHLSSPDGTPAYDYAVIDRSAPQRVIFPNGGSVDVNIKGDVTTSMFPVKAMTYRLPAGMESKPAGLQRGIFAVRVQQQETGFGPSGPPDTPWELVLTHRTGSLETAVARARTTNLAIGFGILLLLALSMGLTLVAVQRERRLAQRQMDFVSSVSHELRTPLAVICSAGENLADGVVEDPQQSRQYGAMVRNEGAVSLKWWSRSSTSPEFNPARAAIDSNVWMWKT
jgi:hypothetical protein